MTVCLAAVCRTPEGARIVGASDRMVTIDSTREFEPDQTKFWNFCPYILVMAAGDTDLQAEILNPLGREMEARIARQPKQWLYVEEIANIYLEKYIAIKTKRAERQFLAPLGMDLETFANRQLGLDQMLVADTMRRLISYQMPGVEAIFAGFDPTGSRLFWFADGRLACRDQVGFAAIGAGYTFAESEMISAGHTQWRSFEDTLPLVYAAKKRAEVGSGVGSKTDMFVLGPRTPYISVNQQVIETLGKEYRRAIRREKRAAEGDRPRTRKIVEAVNAAIAASEKARSEAEAKAKTPQIATGILHIKKAKKR